ncbi:MAM and LDL-receptor class A domain-containing protein 1 [Trichoplax sp. H2]|nr:MAM and LDL-receptor class A domain-containing protein 1 [Trichoplax sp. H2]|eukprot:RDD43405.1 MAM and LDL-receptor class A domain-containing protein 1 [Trichoplax sp. H2]
MLRHSPHFYTELTILIFAFGWTLIDGRVVSTEVDLSCNFERNFCQWENGRYSDSKFAWIRNKGETIAPKTGPKTSSQLHDNATLKSPIIRSSDSHCLRFWYNMNGADASRLQVVSSTSEILWSKKGNHSNIWLLAEVDISSRAQEYKISITGFTGDSYEANIAIDDMTWEKGMCKNTEFKNLKCDFESGYCGWTNAGFDSFDWTRKSGSTSSKYTGPNYDHTMRTSYGNYAYMEASNRHIGEKVVLVSRVLNNEQPMCFSFWYHMCGRSVGNLIIKIVTKTSTEVLWAKKGSQGQKWKEVKIKIMSIPQDYQIYIVAIRGNTWSSDIAIDDIDINEGTCGAEQIQSIRSIRNHPRCGITKSRIPRIIGGNTASPHSVPWQALLKVYYVSGDKVHTTSCGGSLINENWVITASHCIPNKPIRVKIDLGRHNLLTKESYTKQIRIAKSIFRHPMYQYKNSISSMKDLDGDIALIKLNASVNINNFVRPICLPTANDTFNELNSCKVSGWGMTAGQPRHILRYAHVPIVNRNFCNSTYSYNGQLTFNMLCAGYMQGYTSTCYGDSGSPLSCRHRPGAVLSGYSDRWYLAGVVSGGVGCAPKYYPTVYASVTAAPIYRWLSKTLENS